MFFRKSKKKKKNLVGSAKNSMFFGKRERKKDLYILMIVISWDFLDQFRILVFVGVGYVHYIFSFMVLKKLKKKNVF